MQRFPHRRKRSYTLLFFVFVIAIIFLCFQLISFKVLHQEVRSLASHDGLTIEEHPSAIKNTQNKHLKRDGKNCMIEICEEEVKIPLIETNDKRLSQQQLQKIVKEAEIARNDVKDEGLWSYLERTQVRVAARDDVEKHVLGINHHWQHFYERKNFTFTCVLSKEIIPFGRVNDDYCDCEDHSDEPGTAACQNSRFYCQFQLSEGSLKWIPSSRVGDGLCDCCDGSDEWQGATLPDHVLLNDGAEHNGVRQAPCFDRCLELRAKEDEIQKMRQQGLALKEAYIEAAKGQMDTSEYYGPKNVFYKLSQQCFTVKADKYAYELCPFRKVEQKDGAAITNIGRAASWLSKDPARGYKLRMTNGDSRGCPDHGSREAIITLLCGLSDSIQSLSEAERCVYNIEFITPAAC